MRPDEWLGSYCYRQSDTCFPLGQDTLRLAEFPALRPGLRVCDLGCGAGALPLLLLGREAALAVTGVELSPSDAALARENLANNQLDGEIITGDVREIRGLLPAGHFDLVVSNPPYFATGSGASGGKTRMEVCCTLNDSCAAAGWLLRYGGRFALVHRPERLVDLLDALRNNGLEPKRLQQIQHSANKVPSAILIESVRGGRAGLSVLPALIL